MIIESFLKQDDVGIVLADPLDDDFEAAVAETVVLVLDRRLIIEIESEYLERLSLRDRALMRMLMTALKAAIKNANKIVLPEIFIAQLPPKTRDTEIHPYGQEFNQDEKKILFIKGQDFDGAGLATMLES